MLGTFITLPDSFASSTLAVSGGLVSDLSPFLILVIGVILGLLVLVFLIRALTHH